MLLLGHVDGAHAAVADGLEYFVAADDGAGNFGGAKRRGGDGGFGRAVFQERLIFFAVKQKLLHLLAEKLVISTLLSNVSPTLLGGGQLGGVEKDAFGVAGLTLHCRVSKAPV